MKFILQIIFILAISQVSPAGPFVSGGLPDSPSAICEIQAHGLLTTGQSPEGRVPLCTIAGATIEYWTLFRVIKFGQTTMASNAFINHQVSTIAGNVSIEELHSAYCKAIGGNPLTYRNAHNIPFGMCVFPDSSSIDQHTMLVGPTVYSSLHFILIYHQN